MKQSSKTYTRRENARRAGIAAGIQRECLAITAHKIGNDVRFGWRKTVLPTKPAVTTLAKKIGPEERNGITRPALGGVCCAVWDWLDANPDATVKAVKAVAVDHRWNENNVACEFYRWRKFKGIAGRPKGP